jgi:hypothetical protein
VRTSTPKASRAMQPPSTPSTSAQRDLALRRVRSENDLPFPDGLDELPTPPAAGRSQRHTSYRIQRSEGTNLLSPSLLGAEPHTPRVLAPPRLPDQAALRPSGNDRNTDADTFEIIQALNDLPQDIRFEIVGDQLREGQRRGTQRRDPERIPPGWRGKLLVFLGQAGPDMRTRSKLMSFVWSLSFGLVQVGTIAFVPIIGLED